MKRLGRRFVIFIYLIFFGLQTKDFTFTHQGNLHWNLFSLEQFLVVPLRMAKGGLCHVRLFKFLFLLFRELNIDSTFWKVPTSQNLSERRIENKQYQGDHISFQDRSFQQLVPIRLNFYHLSKTTGRNKNRRKTIPFWLIIHASDSCVMLMPLTLAIFSTLILSAKSRSVIKNDQLTFWQFLPFLILAIAFDESEEEEK